MIAWLLDYGRFLITNLLNVLITVAIAAAAGGYGGWTLNAWKTGAEVAKEEKKAIVLDRSAAVDSVRKGEILSAEKYELQTQLDKARKQLAFTPFIVVPPAPATTGTLEVIRNEKPVPPGPQSCASTCGAPMLSLYHVGVLNHALDRSAPDPERWGDDTKQTASENGLREVSDHLIRVAEACRALAKDHDTLVDDVAEYQKKLAGE